MLLVVCRKLPLLTNHKHLFNDSQRNDFGGTHDIQLYILVQNIVMETMK